MLGEFEVCFLIYRNMLFVKLYFKAKKRPPCYHLCLEDEGNIITLGATFIAKLHNIGDVSCFIACTERFHLLGGGSFTKRLHLLKVGNGLQP